MPYRPLSHVVPLLLVAVHGGCADTGTAYSVEVLAVAPLLDYGLPVSFEPIGVTVAPDTGRREIVAMSGRRLLIYATEGPNWTGLVDVEVEDAAALGDGRYALIAPNFGYLLESDTGRVTEHFCYLPGDEEGEWPLDLSQLSWAVAYDATTDRIWAQPRTFDGGTLVRSEVAAFDAATGDDLAWWPLDADFEAGAMAVIPGEGLILSSGTTLHVWSSATGRHTPIGDLEPLGVSSIEALTWDPATQHVLALDSVSRTVLDLELRVSR